MQPDVSGNKSDVRRFAHRMLASVMPGSEGTIGDTLVITPVYPVSSSSSRSAAEAASSPSSTKPAGASTTFLDDGDGQSTAAAALRFNSKVREHNHSAAYAYPGRAATLEECGEKQHYRLLYWKIAADS